MPSKPKAAPATIDDYIAAAPQEVRGILRKMRATIRAAAPHAEEAVKYGLACFMFKGNLVFFGAFKQHIGFYAMPSGHTAFQRELSAYQGAKGSVRFPLNKPIPFKLVTKVVKFRVKENAARWAAKKKAR